jgi:nucleoside-diphosphate-sugar epimerase
MAGQSVVIHCARDAINERGREPDGIVSLIDTAKQSGINRFIYLSSVAVYGQVSGVVTESTLPTPPILPYGENKLRAEKICQAAATRDFRVVVLRPALVYGPYGEEWTVRFVRDLVSGRLTGLGPAGEGIANLVYIDDLARFCVRLATDNIQPFTLLNVNGDDHPSFNEYFERMSSALGFGSLAKPDALYYHEARRFLRRLLRAGFKFQRRIAPPILTQTILGRLQKRMEMRYAYNHWDQCLTVRPSEVLFSNEASKQHGFVSRISLDDGLRAVEKWAREEGLIP